MLFRERPGLAARKSALPDNISHILPLLGRLGVKATFFILGSAARKYPGAVKAIAAGGHEIASHGETHRSVCGMSRMEFRESVSSSRKILGDICGRPPLGYRAPTWSIVRGDEFYLEALREAGYEYDSSLYPAFLSRRPRAPYKAACGLLEFPPSVFALAGIKLPFLGGTFLRLLPKGFAASRLAALNAAGLPGMLYCHSWEFDRDTPAGAGLLGELIQYSNASSVAGKIEHLARGFRFAPAREALRVCERERTIRP